MWSLDKLKAKLEAILNLGNDYYDIQPETFVEAAILVPIIIRNGLPFVLLTVRSMNLTNFPGQVSFPGGKRDPEDKDLVATALREAQEETGMGPERLKILGTLPPYVAAAAKPYFMITPVLAEVLNYETFSPKINPVEVSKILTVPLEIFILKKYHKCKEYAYSSGDKNAAIKEKIDFFEFAENDSVHIIWGLTAFVATHVAILLFEQSPEVEFQHRVANSDWAKSRRKIYDRLIQKSKL